MTSPTGMGPTGTTLLSLPPINSEETLSTETTASTSTITDNGSTSSPSQMTFREFFEHFHKAISLEITSEDPFTQMERHLYKSSFFNPNTLAFIQQHYPNSLDLISELVSPPSTMILSEEKRTALENVCELITSLFPEELPALGDPEFFFLTYHRMKFLPVLAQEQIELFKAIFQSEHELTPISPLLKGTFETLFNEILFNPEKRLGLIYRYTQLEPGKVLDGDTLQALYNPLNRIEELNALIQYWKCVSLDPFNISFKLEGKIKGLQEERSALMGRTQSEVPSLQKDMQRIDDQLKFIEFVSLSIQAEQFNCESSLLKNQEELDLLKSNGFDENTPLDAFKDHLPALHDTSSSSHSGSYSSARTRITATSSPRISFSQLPSQLPSPSPSSSSLDTIPSTFTPLGSSSPFMFISFPNFIKHLFWATQTSQPSTYHGDLKKLIAEHFSSSTMLLEQILCSYDQPLASLDEIESFVTRAVARSEFSEEFIDCLTNEVLESPISQTSKEMFINTIQNRFRLEAPSMSSSSSYY